MTINQMNEEFSKANLAAATVRSSDMQEWASVTARRYEQLAGMAKSFASQCDAGSSEKAMFENAAISARAKAAAFTCAAAKAMELAD